MVDVWGYVVHFCSHRRRLPKVTGRSGHVTIWTLQGGSRAVDLDLSCTWKRVLLVPRQRRSLGRYQEIDLLTPTIVDGPLYQVTPRQVDRGRVDSRPECRRRS